MSIGGARGQQETAAKMLFIRGGKKEPVNTNQSFKKISFYLFKIKNQSILIN